jgi:hypothetical protein
MVRSLAVLVAGGVLAGLVCAQEASTGGTQDRQVLPGPFPAYVVTGQVTQPPADGVMSEERQNFRDVGRIGKFHDFVTQYGLDPTVAIFSHDAPPSADQPLGKLLQGLNQAVDKNRGARLHAFAVFLTLKGEFLQDESQSAQIKQIESGAEQLKLNNVPLALDRTESGRTKAYGIPADASVVALVYVRQTVQARFTFTVAKPLDDAGVQAVLDATNKMIGARK